jgi:hypothetical protein
MARSLVLQLPRDREEPPFSPHPAVAARADLEPVLQLAGLEGLLAALEHLVDQLANAEVQRLVSLSYCLAY